MKEVEKLIKEHDKNLQEVEEARKDYRGNINKSLEDRLNADQDEIYNRFNNATLLPYSDKYITAENSYKGRTSDLMLKGRTLQNLVALPSTATEDLSAQNYAYKLNSHPIKYIGKLVTLINTHDKVIDYQVYTDGGKRTDHLIPAYGIEVLTLATDAYISAVSCDISNGWTNANKNELKGLVLEGDWSNKPVPQYFEGIKSVCETGETLQVKSCGENLFPSNGVFKRTIDGTDWFINHKTYSFKDENGEILKPFRVLPSTSIKIIRKFIGSNRIIVAFFDKNMGVIPHTSYSINNGFRPNESYNGWWINADDIPLIMTPSNAYYMTIGTIQITTFSEICIKTTSLSEPIFYEPYQEDKIELKDLNLRGLDDTIRDTLDSKGVLSRNVGKMILNGSEPSWRFSSVHSFVDKAMFNLNVVGAISYTGLSNHFPMIPNPSLDSEHFYLEKPYLYIWINKSKLTGYADTLTDAEKINLFKAWLQANPTTVYYQLATPTIETIEGAKELNTYDKVTHVWAEGSLIEPTIECKVPSDVQATIATLKLENTALAVENTALKNSVEETKLDIIEESVNQEYKTMNTIIESGV